MRKQKNFIRDLRGLEFEQQVSRIFGMWILGRTSNNYKVRPTCMHALIVDVANGAANTLRNSGRQAVRLFSSRTFTLWRLGEHRLRFDYRGTTGDWTYQEYGGAIPRLGYPPV